MSSSPAIAAPPVTSQPRLLYDACPLCSAAEISALRTGDCSGHPLYKPVVGLTIVWMRCAPADTSSPTATSRTRSRRRSSPRPTRTSSRARGSSRTATSRPASWSASRATSRTAAGSTSVSATDRCCSRRRSGASSPKASICGPRPPRGCSRLGIEAHCADLTSLDAPGRYSVISLADVLEHMPYPGEGLVAAHRLLREDGVIFASMPNYDCAVWRLLDAADANPYWGSWSTSTTSAARASTSCWPSTVSSPCTTRSASATARAWRSSPAASRRCGTSPRGRPPRSGRPRPCRPRR